MIQQLCSYVQRGLQAATSSCGAARHARCPLPGSWLAAGPIKDYAEGLLSLSVA